MLDIAVALAAILFCLPLFAAVTLAIVLDSRGPVLFRQRRAGQDGKLFGIYKFRSMHVLEDGTGPAFLVQSASLIWKGPP